MTDRFRAALYFDYGSGCCLWPDNDRTSQQFGYPIDHDDLPLGPETVAKLHQLCDHYDRSLNWDSPSDPSPWRQAECDRFNADVAATIDRLRRELGPGWEVIDNFDPLAEDPDLDRYLADPKAYRR